VVSRDEALREIEDSLDRPSAARIYDYFIGGGTNYAIDREFARTVRQRIPLIGEYCKTSRQFLGRAVRHCAELGVRQFVDIGSGLPTAGNVHEVADQARPGFDSRVLYIDNEPVALAHSTLLLADTADPGRHKAIVADFLRPEDLWERVAESGIIDLRTPIALVINAVLHFVRDNEKPDALLDFYRQRLAPGSLLVLSQMTHENPRDEDERRALADLVAYYDETTNPAQLRTTAEFARFFGDWEMLDPGLVYAPAWHPDSSTLFAEVPSQSRVLGGVARKTPS
jgi:O-methyltransferase involved in polyketide biosynthesis